MFRMMSALRITRTFMILHPVHLAPFAWWTAFPSSDYYGASVALGVAPGRRSRVPCVVDVQDGVGAPFVPLWSPMRPSPLGACGGDEMLIASSSSARPIGRLHRGPRMTTAVS